MMTEMDIFGGGGTALNPTFSKEGSVTSFSAEVGKHYIICGWQDSGSSTLAYNRCDITSMTGGTYEKLGNAYTSGTGYISITYTYVTATSTTVSFTTNGSANLDLIQLD